MRVRLNSVFVTDQEAALHFYTQVLGFVKATDIPMGEFRWLTVVSPEDPDGAELVLEPNSNPAAATYQRALFDGGSPLTSFEVDDLEDEYRRLEQAGVRFTSGPTDVGTAEIAIFDDTCGNLIMIYEVT